MMPALINMSASVIMAIALSIAMIVMAILTWFFHDTKHRDLDDWIQYGFSGDTLRHVLIYYRSMGISMLVFYILFVVSCLFLQSDGIGLFVDSDNNPISAGPIGAALFGLDLVLRGGFFDIMEHFEISVTPILMDRSNQWFVIYCFVFRIYYGLTLIRIALSFVWIWARMRRVRRTLYGEVRQPRERSKRHGFRLRLRERLGGRKESEDN
ncbi:membrane protein of unknown function [Candidatus Filomicrobium marinum]|uniref:Uncharacterized protein n=3 Tax=Hyphomicrobiaceae TaxID=45401 RepID=A0A0D6JEJ9_9HYPH|nr:hypothetical protein [Candidatus Filomicrobium marinum]CFX16879.1 membrane protein of unknown function [Candidatus Filomicrobium marinum]CPR18160.1 membrane protein of unknown function [Candidatus Filomicrobium marinum]SDO22974.1 hypothetical protein SAMN04488061_0631 [Filomicrobium insigne]